MNLYIANKELLEYYKKLRTYNNYMLMITFILSITAFLTSMVSAIIGMGGGILLLSVMTFFLPMAIIIPVHGLVQLISNFSRVFILRKNIVTKFLLYFVLGLPIGASLAVYILKEVFSETHGLIAVLILIIYALFKPKRLPQLKLRRFGWTGLGFFTGVLAIIVGAVGPLIAPFFIRDDLDKKEIIATKASLQMMAHFIKIPAFFYLDFNYSEHKWLILVLGIMAVLGTKFGTKILDKVETQLFKRLYKIVLGLSGIRIILKLLE